MTNAMARLELVLLSTGVAWMGLHLEDSMVIAQPAPLPDIIINGESRLPPPGGNTSSSSSNPRFTCEYHNGQYTVMYLPPNQSGQAYPWAIPRTLGNGWSAQRRCQEISRRLEIYRPDGLAELSTGYENGYQTICATTSAIPQCRIVLTVPPGQNAETVRNQVFASLTVADNGQMTQGVNAFAAGTNSQHSWLGKLLNPRALQSLSSSPVQNGRGINLKPFLAPEDGGTGKNLTTRF